jgi:site-specific DNA recombinase
MTKRAAIYCRISRDAEQEGLGVARQEDDCRALVEREGWTLVEPPYVDNDISASTLSKKTRPAYDAMLEAARRGEFDVIVAYSNSRLTRRLMELQGLIDLHDKHGVRIATVVSGSDDLSTADGRMTANIKASVDQAEAERTAERLRRAFLAKAQAGSVNQGHRPFGWADDKAALHPEESRLIRRAIGLVIDGLPLREVARQWNKAGVTTTRGKEWNHTAVRQVLRNPRLAGWRTHQGEIARGPGGEKVRGVWEPIVEQGTFDALQAALDGRGHRRRRGAQKYLLSGVARCGVCGARMHGYRVGEGRHAYSCGVEGQDHTVTIAGRQTDDLLSALVERRLATADLSAAPVEVAEWPGEARLREIPGLVADLMTAFRDGVISGSIVFPMVQTLQDEQAALERERPTAAPRPSVATPEDFAALDPDRRRAVVAALVEAVVVSKADRRGSPWTPDRLQVVWRS